MNADGSGTPAVSKEDFCLFNNPKWHPNGRHSLARKHCTGTCSAGSAGSGGSGEIWMFHLEGGSKLQQSLSMLIDGHTGIEHALPVAVAYKEVTRHSGCRPRRAAAARASAISSTARPARACR